MKKLLIAFLFLCFSSQAFAQTVITRYVRTDNANNGDGTTSGAAASPGAAGAYTTLQNAVTDIVADYPDFVASNVQIDVDCAGIAADVKATIDGATTDATRFWRIFTTQANRHDGKWNTSKYRIENSSGSLENALTISDQYVTINGIQASRVGPTGTGSYGSAIGTAAGSLDIKLYNSIIRGAACNAGGGGFCWGLDLNPNVANARLTVVNNVAYGAGGVQLGMYSGNGNNGEINIVFNNTGYGGQFGIRLHAGGGTDTLYMRNNVVQSNSTAGYNLAAGSFTTLTTEKNITADATSPDVSFRSLTCSFVSTTGGSEDFHLQAGDTNCKDAGANLSADPQYSFTTDIDADTRSAPWDIGADEYATTTTTTTTTTLATCNRKGQKEYLCAKGQL